MNIDIFWYGSEDLTFRRNVSHPILSTFSSHTEYVEKESIIFPLFLSILLNINRKQTQKKSSEKELRHFAFYRTGTIIFAVLAW